MKNIFYPNEYLDSAYSIDYEKMFKKGYRGIIFDIDNTLVEHGAPANEKAIELFERLKRIGFKCVLLSNNKEPRVKSFNDKVKVQYIFKGNKPHPAGYRRAMEMMSTNEKNTFFVGDQIFTDVMGANIAGIYTILTKPINPKEEIQIVLKRYLEKPIIFSFERRKKYSRIEKYDKK
ncbi:MAG: YqeG family HAD IIIA-type phosphatase [Lachnospiraceae bacterium]|nr:YqeG family HAD IIIA-type phosphatase [Lachnospiraceae bacterium]